MTLTARRPKGPENRWSTTFRDPGALTVRERHAEIVDILSRGLGHYAAELPGSRASGLEPTEDAAEVSQNQLDAHAQQSVYAPDGNT
jgi:hypothetical protein